MWAIIKFDKKKFNFLKSQLKLSIGSESNLYCPKVLIENFKNNKIVKREINLLGDYLFCFNEKFKEKNIINKLNSTKGVKYFLDGFSTCQNDIEDFVKKCKNLENNNGHITQPVFETKINKFYKFSSGPFTQQIFKILTIQRNKIKILMGNISTTIDKRRYSLSPL
tara:strand:+ start:449 stop:946 length:498 start_codon:yes stop_codon:yes gene_type:complete